MKPSEFYEKYWKIKNKDGVMSNPPPLRKFEKDFLDSAIDNSNLVYFYRKRTRSILIYTAELSKQFKQLPEFLKS